MKLGLIILFQLSVFLCFSQSNNSVTKDSLVKEKIFIEVDNTAYPALCIQEFYKSILTYCKMNYPIEAKKAGVQGRVCISYVVDVDGSITNVSVKKGINSLIDEVGVNAVKKYEGKWVPGAVNGVYVKQQMIIPINFKL